MADEPGSAHPGAAGANKRWPVLGSLASYRTSFLTRDLIAGLTLAAIAIPEQMATARLGGFSPEVGFFAFLAGSLAFAVFGSNRFLSCGADSTVAPIFAGTLALLAAPGSAEYAALAAALALMVGLLLVAGGIFRLGWIADLLSIPVTIGFLAGISVHILVSQLPTVLGLPAPDGKLLQRIADLAGAPSRNEPLYAPDRRWRPGGHRPIGSDQPTHSRSIDRARLGDRGRCRVGTRRPWRHGSGRRFRRPADAGHAGHHGGTMGRSRAAEPHHRERRHGADGRHNAILSVRPQRASRRRSRFCRRRGRQYPGKPVRRVSAERQPATHRNRVRDRRSIAARRPRRGRHRAGIGGIRRGAAAPCSTCGAGRGPAVRGAADHPHPPDRGGLSAVVWRIPADCRDRRRHRCPARSSRASRSASRSRFCTAYGARHAPASWCSSGCPEPRSGGRASPHSRGEREPGIIVAGICRATVVSSTPIVSGEICWTPSSPRRRSRG